MKNISIIFVLITFFSAGLLAQNNEGEDQQIKLIVKAKDNKHILRWGFPTAESWFASLKTGVEVYQVEIRKEGSLRKKMADVKPLSKPEIESLAENNEDAYEQLAMVAYHLHDEWENSRATSTDEIFQKSDNFVNRWSMLHFAADKDAIAAAAAGLRFETDDFDINKKYAYQVVVKGKYSSSDLSTVFPFQNTRPIIYDIVEKENELIIHWDKRTHENKFSSYYIEQSKGDTDYKRLNKNPFVQMFDDASIDKGRYFAFKVDVENDVAYNYRIVGVDAFGDESEPSFPYMASAKDRTPPPSPSIDYNPNNEHLEILLVWSQESPEEVVKYHLEVVKNGITTIEENFANPQERSKTLAVPDRGIYTLRLIAEDKNGNISYSDKYFTNAVDVHPPKPPTGVTAVADTTGVVVIAWDEPVDKDVVGYFVFSADNQMRAFEALNGRSHQYRVYTDTLSLNLLNESKFYKVVAIDSDGKRSKFSESVKIAYPDVIPPAPALIADYSVTDNCIELELRPSSSRDVVEHHLLRKKEGGEWTTVFRGAVESPIYRDSTISSNVKYTYRFLATDDVGLQSKSVQDFVIKSMHYRAKDLELKMETVAEGIKLTWNNVSQISKLVLYKKAGELAYTKVKVDPSKGFYIDTSLEEQLSYAYKAQAITNEGYKSPFTKELKVNR